MTDPAPALDPIDPDDLRLELERFRQSVLNRLDEIDATMAELTDLVRGRTDRGPVVHMLRTAADALERGSGDAE